MSLDVYLEGEPIETACVHCDGTGKNVDRNTIYSANITHNLGKMAEAAGIYQHLWRPDELGITKAGGLIGPLREGLWRLKANPALFKKYDAPNGWGLYEHFVPFVEKYLDACTENPDANVRVWR